MTSEPLHIAIFGAGSIGCYLGGQLVSSGATVTFIGRQRFKSSIETHGLKLTHFERGDITLKANKFIFSLNSKGIAQADIILLTTKSQDTASAAESIKAYARPKALIISFQNGVSNPNTLRETLGHQVLGGVVPFNVTGKGPGQFHCGTEGELTVQDATDERLALLRDYFSKAGQGLIFSENISAVQWGKLLVNLNNALNTLTGGTLKAGLMQRDYRKALVMVIGEALNIIRGAGIEPAKFGRTSPTKMMKILHLPNFLYAGIMNGVVKIDASARSSMLDDLEMERVSEIDYLQGEIVRLAKQTAQNAPYNTAIYNSVQRAFAIGTSPKMSGTDIYRSLMDTQK